MTDDTQEDFATMLAEYDVSSRGPEVGDSVSGKIVTIGAEHLFVDLGGKAEGSLALDQLVDDQGKLPYEVGDSITARVLAIDDHSGVVMLRAVGGRGPDMRGELQEAFNLGVPVDGLVSAVNKGGVEVQLGAVRAFCPMSQLDIRFVEDAESYVGKKLQFRITRYEGGRRANVVVSRRSLLAEEAKEQAAITRATMEVGTVLRGTVTSLQGYGAFVDLGGLEGMIHVSELGFQRVQHPQDVLAVGQEIDVQVLRIEQTGDAKRPEKIALSLRSLEPDPWKDADQRYAEGSSLTGEVMRVEKYGAFVEVAPGVEGLVHVSQLGADRRVNHAREVVTVGTQVQVRVLSVDLAQRRISLTMAAKSTEPEVDQRFVNRTEGLGTLGDLFSDRLKK